MQSFFDWFKQENFPDNLSGLILGKGPSFSKRRNFDISKYLTMSLNHAVREQPVKLAHIIDLDVIDHLGGILETNAEFVVMPWHPHVSNDPGQANLEDIVNCHSILQRLDKANRLLWYNLGSAKAREGYPVIQARFFSAEAAINLLAKAGVKTIRSLGIDGGSTYSSAFDDLKDKTLLANGRQNFDAQFQEIAMTILRTGIDYAPLDAESPIRVFVAATEAQMLAVKVLEFSIRKHTSMSVVVTPIHRAGLDIPLPRDPKNQPRTPFSFQRFLIPQLMNWKGRAIYLDSDMQVFRDMRHLWSYPMNGAQILAAREPGISKRRPQFSVMMLDCAALDWNIADIVKALDGNRLTYEQLMWKMEVADRIRADIEPSWNSLERYDEKITCLLHYTDMNTQPWVSLKNGLGHLWMRDLFEAIDAGFITREYVEEHVRQSWVRPSLLYQIDRRFEDTVLLPKLARNIDKEFIAPYCTLPQNPSSPWQNPLASGRALFRRFGSSKIKMKIGRSIAARLPRALVRAISARRH